MLLKEWSQQIVYACAKETSREKKHHIDDIGSSVSMQ